MKKKLLFVYNPNAGRALLKPCLSDVIDIFTKDNYFVTAYPTQKKGDALKVIEKSNDEGYDLIVCSGGDGTLSESITGLMKCENRPNLGYIPAGSTNDFANSLKIPRNMVRAAENVIHGTPFAYDVGSLNDRHFCYVAAFGAFTAVSYETPQTFKNIFGHLAYVLEGAKSLGKINSYKLKIEYDGNTIEDTFILGMITNTISVGGILNLKKKGVLFDDGLFEVTLVRKPSNPIEWSAMITNLLAANTTKNTHLNAKYFYKFKTANLKITSEEKIAWTVDGENGGSYTEMNIVNHKQAINIIIPYSEIFEESAANLNSIDTTADSEIEAVKSTYFDEQNS